jgi:putative FmdB family regulatory protein
MPTYEYVCSDCDNHWEEVQKISENPIEVCPKCGKSTAKRQISGGNFILKGGGWYADLYSSTPKGKGGGETKSEGSSTAAAAKTDAAPAAAAPAASAPSTTSASTGSSGTKT